MDVQTATQLFQEAAIHTQNMQPERAAQQYEALLEATTSSEADAPVKTLRLRAFDKLCLLLGKLGRFPEGLSYAQAYYQEAKTLEHQSAALTRIASYAVRTGYYQLAYEASEENCWVTERSQNDSLKAKAWTSRAHVFFSTGRLQEAVACLKDALPLLEQQKDQEGQEAVWNRLGLAYQHLGEIDKAISSHQKLLFLAERKSPPDLPLQMAALDNLGESYLMLFDMPKALEYFKRGLDLTQKISNPYLAADLYRNQGEALIYLGETVAGLDSLHRAFALCEQPGDATITVQVLYSLAIAEFEVGQVEMGYQHASHLYQLAVAGDLRSYRAKSLYALGLYHQYEGNIQMAEQCWQESLFLAHDTGQRVLIWQLHARLAEIAPSLALSRIHYQIAAEVIEQIAEPIEDETLRQTFLTAWPIQLVFQELL